MFGFIVGTACLVGLAVVLHRSRSPFGRCGHGRRSPLYWAFERLDTSPAQERVIREVIDDLFESGRDLRQGFKRSRRDVAEALRSEALDEAALDALFERHGSELGAFREKLVGALRQIHETLDERQRRRLADFIESSFGSPFRHHQGPYRSPA